MKRKIFMLLAALGVFVLMPARGITKFKVNQQCVKALLPGGEVRYIRVSAAALKKGLVTKASKRIWKKGDEAKKS